MTIQYMSDLHLEFKDNVEFLRRLPFKVTGDILIVAGDSFYLDNEDGRKSFLWQWASDNYEHVLLIPGNHEYYGGYDFLKNGDSWEWKFMSNVGYYQNKVVTIGDIDFILSTLWSYIPPENQSSVSYFLNDFHRIKYDGREFTIKDYNIEHAKSLAFIKKTVADSKAKHKVVVTHHVPTKLCTPPKLNKIRGGTLAPAFTIDLTDYIRTAPIDYWIYGHSHFNFGVDIGGTLVTCNQLGYIFRKEYEWNGFEFGKGVIIS